MDLFYGIILKLLVFAKPAAPGIAGAVLNSLITHYKVVIRGARALTFSNRVVSMAAALLIGLGSTYIVHGYYDFIKEPELPGIYRAVFFISSAGGLEVILWLTGHAASIADKLEERYLAAAVKKVEAKSDRGEREKEEK